MVSRLSRQDRARTETNAAARRQWQGATGSSRSMALDTFRRQQEGGPPGKALARKAIPADIRSLCRAYTEESIRHLAAIMRQREDSAAARVQAANILLDRGWGKPPQAHTGEDGKNISVTIRQIVERGDED